MADVEKTVLYKFVVSAEEAIQIMKAFRADINTAKEDILRLQKRTGQSFQDIADGLSKAAEKSKRFAYETGEIKDPEGLKRYKQTVSEAVRELEKGSQATTKFAGAMGVLKNALAVVGIYGFVQVIRQLIGFFAAVTKEALGFAQSIFKLGVSIRAMQKRGLDITIAQTTEQIKRLRKEFGFFTTREIVDGIAQVQLLTKNFGFSADQMEEMFRVSSALAVVLGKDVNEAAKELALFLSSGYGEALQRAGLAVNIVAVQEEALRKGYKEGYRQLNQQVRAQMGWNVVLRESADLLDEFNNYQESAAGKIVEAQKNIEEQKNMIGLKLLPVYELWNKLQLQAIKLFEWWAKAWINIGIVVLEQVDKLTWPFFAVAAAAKTANGSLTEFWKNLAAAGRAAPGEVTGGFIEELEKLKEEFDLADMLGKDYKGPTLPGVDDSSLTQTIKNLQDDFIDAFENLQDDLEDAFDDLYSDLGDIAKEGQDGLAEIDRAGLESRAAMFRYFNSIFADAGLEAGEQILENEQDMLGELGDIDEEGLQDLLDIWTEYYRDLEDIQRKMEQQLADAELDYQRDLADVDTDVIRKQEDAARKYHESELKAERDFQERMLKLREQFLFDLEDALHEQDARQILRLIRRFNMEQDQLKRQKDLDAADRADAYQRELEDIQKWAQRRREELALELERRRADIALAAERDREDAARDRQRAFDELMEDQAREREERLKEYEDELEDIKEKFNDKLTDIVSDEFKDFEGSTGDFTNAVNTLLNNAFGQNGVAQSIFDALGIKITETTAIALARAQELRALADQMATSVVATPDYYTNPELKTPGAVPGMAEGGTLIANRPTTALFAEKGPEAAIFVPLNKMSSVLESLSSIPRVGGTPGADGRLVVELLLTPDLEARIIDSTLNQAGEEMLNIIGVRK